MEDKVTTGDSRAMKCLSQLIIRNPSLELLRENTGPVVEESRGKGLVQEKEQKETRKKNLTPVHARPARHLRRVRRTLQQRCDIMSAFVGRFFPSGTRITRPSGGYVLWIELPPGIDSMALYQQALAAGITIAPGRLFSTSDASA